MALVLLLVAGCASDAPVVDPPSGHCEPQPEVAGDGIDQDCNGLDPEADNDGDGYGTASDCDDADPQVHPRALEICDGLDQDCNGSPADDEIDEDQDGYSLCGGDCAPDDPDIYPGAPDSCDDIDSDCHGGDEDADGDGVFVCAGDCDDADATISPNASESCDGVDEDCDGVLPADEVDADGDSWLACEECDDTSASVTPSFVEVCDGIDDDCDGGIDEDCVTCDVVVPGDAPTVQGGIDMASTGDIVCVQAGTWYENIDFGGAEVTLLGLAGEENTVLDGSGLDTVVAFRSAEGTGTVLTGFTITHGDADSWGGGILIDGASPTIIDLVVTDNSHGLWASGGAPSLLRVRVTDNEGRGLTLESADAVLEDVQSARNYIAGNADGAGIYVEGGTLSLTNVEIAHNGSYWGSGIGIYAVDTTIDLTNVRIVHNVGAEVCEGGGIYLNRSTLSGVSVVIADNSTMWFGGGMSVWSSTVHLRNSVIFGNEAFYSASGIDTGASSTFTFAYCDVEDGNPDFEFPSGVDGNVSVDPLFEDDAYHLSATSPLLDAGDPAILDPDGTTSDMGAWGGPGAASFDLDGDGYAAWWLPGAYDAATSPGADCDDDDATVHPGAGC